MATHDYVIDNSTGANVRADINNVLQAILTNNSSSSAPSTTAAYMWWADTTNGVLKIRNSANNGWVELLQLDGTITLEDGNATTPALAFRDDLNTGIYSSAANTFNVATGGTERMELGTTTIFNEDGADVDFRIEGDTEANLFYVDASTDRIGIGTSSPSTTLNIFAPPLNTATLTTTNCLQLGLWVKPDGTGSNTSGHIYTGITLADGFAGMYGVDAGASAATHLAFFTGNTSAVAERIRIDSSGRLLIGHTGVGSKGAGSSLQIQTSNTAASAITIKNRASHNDFSFIYFTDDDASEDLVQVGVARTGASEADIVIYTNDGDTASQERLRIDSIGHVEISTEVAANGNVGLQLDTSNTSNASSLLFQAGGENRAQLLVQRVAGDGGYVALQVARTDNSNSLVNVFTATPSTSGDTTPDLTLAGNLVLASGNGINFNATADASGTGITAGSELLDDYEEGTWTPVMQGGTTTGSPTHYAQHGFYVKIGRFVHAYCNIAVSALGGAAGNLRVAGLPFTGTNGLPEPTTAAQYNQLGSGLPTNTVTAMAILQNPNTYAEFRCNMTSNVAFSTLQVQLLTYFRFNLQYVVD